MSATPLIRSISLKRSGVGAEGGSGVGGGWGVGVWGGGGLISNKTNVLCHAIGSRHIGRGLTKGTLRQIVIICKFYFDFNFSYM